MKEKKFRKLVTDWHYSKITEYSMEPNEIEEEHAHDTDGFALLLEGELTIEKGSGDQTGRAGDIVKYPMNEAHTEKAGPKGVRFLFAELP